MWIECWQTQHIDSVAWYFNISILWMKYVYVQHQLLLLSPTVILTKKTLILGTTVSSSFFNCKNGLKSQKRYYDGMSVRTWWNLIVLFSINRMSMYCKLCFWRILNLVWCSLKNYFPTKMVLLLIWHSGIYFLSIKLFRYVVLTLQIPNTQNTCSLIGFAWFINKYMDANIRDLNKNCRWNESPMIPSTQ